jgi:hypothetical protein
VTPVPLLAPARHTILAVRMLRSDRHPRPRSGTAPASRRRAYAVVVAAAVLLLFATVAPTFAAAGPTRLSDPVVTPRLGLPTTTFTVTVTYRNREGSPADWVRVKVAGSARAMTHIGGSDWKQGVTFRWRGKLPVGKFGVSIEARSRDHFTDLIAAGDVQIKLPLVASTPQPTPKPTPKPTPRPTPQATPPPTPEATSTPTPTTAPVATAPLGTSPEPTDVATSEPTPEPSDDAIAVVPGGSSPPGGGAGAPIVPDVVTGAATVASGGGILDAFADAADLLGSGRPAVPLSLVATLVSTSGVVGATLAFGLFGKRRRDGEPPEDDDVLAEQAATPLAVAQASAYVDGRGRGAATAVANAPSALQAELAMPRWRRPSLLEARRADPVRDATPAPRLTFDHGLVGPLEGHERRLIRYSLVRLLDIPDELRGTELAFLDQGDEVQLLEKRGVYWLVLCPDGLQGWIHKMTLGETVGQPSISSTPTATMPIAAETWTMGDDIDGDVLAAYLESRRRV